MQGIRAGFQHDANDGPAGATHARVECGLHFELLHRIGGRRVGDAGAIVCVAGLCIWDAIDGEVGGAERRALNRRARAGGVHLGRRLVVEAVRIHVVYTRSQVHQRVGAAVRKRKLRNALAVDDGADIRAGGLQQGGFRGDLDGLGARPEFQREIQLHMIGDAQFNVVAHAALKARGRRGNAVPAREQQRDYILAFGIRAGLDHDIGGQVPHLDLGGRHECAGGVADLARDGGPGFLAG